MGEEKGNTKRAQELRLTDIPKYEDVVNAVKRAYNAARKNKYPLKDVALVATLAFTGCRLGEALELRKEDVDTKRRTVTIKQEKKGGEFVRVVPVPAEVFWAIMRDYLRGVISGERLFRITKRGARYVVYRFTERWLGRRYRPHALRHAYAVFIVKNIRDLEAVRRLLGHSTYKWLKVYLNYSQEDLSDYLEEAFAKVV